MLDKKDCIITLLAINSYRNKNVNLIWEFMHTFSMLLLIEIPIYPAHLLINMQLKSTKYGHVLELQYANYMFLIETLHLIAI